MNNRLSLLIVGVAAVVGIVLGAMALSQMAATKKAVADLQSLADGQRSEVAQVKDDVRVLAGNVQMSLDEMNGRMVSLRAEMTNTLAKAAAPAAKTDAARKPGAAEPQGPGTTHTIEKLNPNANPSRLKIGQKIRVK
jgi:TolA-binding protein